MTDVATAMVQANEAMTRGAWEEARPLLEAVLREGESAEAYEGLSWCAWALNDSEALFHAREEAYRLYRQVQDTLGSARMAMWIGSDYIDFRGERSISNGWHQRARRLLEGVPLTAEHGWLLLLEGDVALLMDNNATAGQEAGRQAIKIGRQLGIPDIEILGLAMEGLALVLEGNLTEGMQRLDEASASALIEMTDPAYVAWALCYVIDACELVHDFDRAVQWLDTMREHAERSQMKSIRAMCRIRFAGVLIWRGDWQAAELELSEASRGLEPHRPTLAAESTVRLADLRHRQGRLNEAHDLFRRVEWHPMASLGLARLALEAGRPKDAQDLAERFLRQIPDASRTQRAAALELLARAEALLGNHTRAIEAFRAVEAVSSAVSTAPLRAATCFSAGALAIAAGDFELARTNFEDAVDQYERCSAPYESARARLELASVLVSLDRLERAQAEAEVAEMGLQRLGSTFYAGRAAALLTDIARRQTEAPADMSNGPLTERQVEILRLISRGLNDREIAATLVVSEHTVHRHVANILQRLDLPSRAAAVAYASSQGII
jgi:ATP/maltotriose-dependent transcriptional regulator MalT